MTSKQKSNMTIGISAVMLNVLFWGIAPPIIKFGLDSVPPQVFLYYRFLIACLIALPAVILNRKTFLPLFKVKHILTLIFVGIFSTLNLGVLFYGLTYTTSSAAAVITTSVPLLVILGSAIFLKEHITKNEVIGSLAAMVGTFLIIATTPTQQHASNPVFGNTIVVIYNIIWTAGILLMKKFAKTYSPFVFGYTGWLTGLTAFGVATLITHPQYIIHPEVVFSASQVILPIAYMAIFGSIVAFTAYQVAQKHLDASQVSIFTYLQTIVAVPISIFWLKEKLSTQFFFGIMLIILGVIFAEIHPTSRISRLYKRKKK